MGQTYQNFKMEIQNKIETIKRIIQHFKVHPGIKEIKKHYSPKEPITSFSFPKISKKNKLSKLTKSLNPNTSLSPDEMPSKILKNSTNIIGSYQRAFIDNALRKK